MSSIGYRRKGDSSPLYNPERDYAYITPTLMRQAIEKLDANDDANRAHWRAANNITDAEIVSAAEALAAAQRDFVNAADPVKSFAEALSRHKFLDLRYCVQQYLWAAIGEIFCAAWFIAVREVSIVGEESPAQADMARFVATVREFANKHKSSLYDAKFMAEHLTMTNTTLRAREIELVSACQHRLDVINALQQQNKQLQQEIEQLKSSPRGFFARLFSRRTR